MRTQGASLALFTGFIYLMRKSRLKWPIPIRLFFECAPINSLTPSLNTESRRDPQRHPQHHRRAGRRFDMENCLRQRIALDETPFAFIGFSLRRSPQFACSVLVFPTF